MYAEENNISIAQSELDFEEAKIGESDAFGIFVPNANASVTTSANTGLSFDPTTQEPVTTTILTANGGLSSNVNLFNGLRNINRLRRAKMNSLANQYRLDEPQGRYTFKCRFCVFKYYFCKRKPWLPKKHNMPFTEQDLKRTSELVDAGVLPKGDLLEIEATAAGQEQQIVLTENQVIIAKISLAQLLQITDYDNFDIAEIDIDVPHQKFLYKPLRRFLQKLYLLEMI
ncbi:TolC family protein [Winogradskyella maritima]|nr:TolC family protein [Winogradskyella maritima]